MRLPLWIILIDGDFDGMAHGATVEEAARSFYGPDEDLTDVSGIRVTPELRTIWRNNRRRERYAEIRDNGPGHKSRARPVPEGFAFELSWSAEMSIHDVNGRCRCPHCSRFCVRADFAGARTGAVLNDGHGGRMHVSLGAACWRCRGMERAPYDVVDASP